MVDRALQERIIGAVVLVAFAVLVVPIFLDGPSKYGAEISEAITLPGQDGQVVRQQTIVLQRDRTEPVPSASADTGGSRDTGNPASLPAPRETREAPSQAAAAKTASPASRDESPAEQETSSTGMWAVQLGSFSNRQNAERLAADLRGNGYAAFLSKLGTGGSSLHRVRVGPQKDRENAETVAARLAAQGHQGQVVPHP